MFLLENDIWETDEVYGRYLIEKNKVSYYRRDRKIREFEIDEGDSISEWICDDAIEQIKKQFNFLWKKLETEIKVCMEEDHLKQVQTPITSNYLKEQLKTTEDIAEDWTEAALLSLGRISEMWLLNELGETSKPYNTDIIRIARLNGIIDDHQSRLLRKINRHYNSLKHKTYYNVDKDLIVELIKSSIKIIN